MGFIGKTFLRGLATILPIALTLYVLWWLATAAESTLGDMLRFVLPDVLYFRGMGIALGFTIAFAVGLLTRAWLTGNLLRLGERALQRVPLVKTIYGPLKDLMAFFAESERRDKLNQVVSVEFAPGNARVIGFLTRESARSLTRRGEDAEHVAVYVPMSYQIGGFLVLVPRASITPLALGVEEAMRMVVTAGVSFDE